MIEPIVVEDEGDELDAEDRARLEAAIEATFATDPSTWRSVDEVLVELRADADRRLQAVLLKARAEVEAGDVVSAEVVLAELDTMLA